MIEVAGLVLQVPFFVFLLALIAGVMVLDAVADRFDSDGQVR